MPPTDYTNWQAVPARVVRRHKKGQGPFLIGNAVVDASEHLSALLTAMDCSIASLNARQNASRTRNLFPQKQQHTVYAYNT